MARPDKSRVGTDAAMRARDVSRPREGDLRSVEKLAEERKRRPARQPDQERGTRE